MKKPARQCKTNATVKIHEDATKNKKSRVQGLFSITLSRHTNALNKIDYSDLEQNSDDLIVIKRKKLKIHGTQLKMFKEQNWSTEHIYKHAKAALAKRRVAIPTETIQRATDLQIKQLAEKEYERIGELQSALIGRANSGRCYLEEKRKRSTLQRRREARKKIEKIIDEGPINHQMPIEDVRWRIEVNPSTSVYFNESQELYKPNSNLVFKHTSTNKSTMEGSYRMQLRVNAEIEQEEELTCHCVDVCGDLCPCSGLRKIIREGPLSDPNRVRHYSCSTNCKCRGKCAISFPEPPKGGTEIMLHHLTEKDFCVRAKQYFGQGEAVVEMTGEYVVSSSISDEDTYALDVVYDTDKYQLAAIIDTNKKQKSVKKYPPFVNKKYTSSILELHETPLSLNPRYVGNVGRFVSSSCMGNVKLNFVHTAGFNPGNIRVIFTSTMPIFPSQEVTFRYSDEYIIKQLGDCCKCASLCCITNRALYPFVTLDDLQRMNRKIQDMHFDEFIKNTAAPQLHRYSTRFAVQSSNTDTH
ncbi:SET domain-containing protein [Caenorhabditis elegans]|uniref:SET domain-containing protein n=1 Tax=Caenorhabditis elegans TaxID=6239 RepID=A0A5E4LYP2_CAEEL|nr:SET domain-containing protein [Caenorhabditis elegans]VVC12400.1 SET domain-containing protein [Caenorhabditis elegans]